MALTVILVLAIFVTYLLVSTPPVAVDVRPDSTFAPTTSSPLTPGR